jgi:hypothetical protein
LMTENLVRGAGNEAAGGARYLHGLDHAAAGARHRWAMSPALANPSALIGAVKRLIPEPL